MQSFTITIAEILADMRKQRGLKQTDMAEAVGISQSTWSRIELGQTCITLENFYKASNFLNVQPSMIISIAEKEKNR